MIHIDLILNDYNKISCLSDLPVGMAGSGAPGPTLGVLFDICEVFCRALCVCILGLEPPKSFFGSRKFIIQLIFDHIIFILDQILLSSLTKKSL